MKRITLDRILVLAMTGLVLAGCGQAAGKAEEETASAGETLREVAETAFSEDTDQTAGMEEEQETAITEETDADALLIYRDVIAQYEEAQEADFYMQPEGWVDPSLSGDFVSDLLIIHTQYYRSADGNDLLIAYALRDINGDGISEFFVGAGTDMDAMTIYSVFTNDGTDPVPLTDVSYYGERINLHVLADGRLADLGSGGAAYTYISFYSLPAEGLELLTDQAYAMEEGKVYYSDDEKDHVSLSEEEWDRALDAFEGPCMDLPWTLMTFCENR